MIVLRAVSGSRGDEVMPHAQRPTYFGLVRRLRTTHRSRPYFFVRALIAQPFAYNSNNSITCGTAIGSFLASGRKLLGICIGCQVIFDRSEERDTPCLGLIPGIVRRFPPGTGLKVPHMGWNAMHFTREHPVFDGIPQDTSFYFVHSYYPDPVDRELVAAVTEYGGEFPSCIARGNLVAFQCHVEKSGPHGLRLLSNFLSWDGKWAPAPARAAAHA